MADIRKRVGKKGTTYQVRYPSKAAKSGYAFKSFDTLKEARGFLEGGETRKPDSSHHSEIRTVKQAADLWLKICEKEGLNGREPVTTYTYKNYEYRASFITLYDWQKGIHELTALVVKKLIRIEISTCYQLLSMSQCLCVLPQMRLRIG